MLRRKALETDTVMAAPLHWTEMAPVGTAGTALGAVEAVVGTAVVDSQGKPAAVVEAVLDTTEGAEVAELPDALVDLEWSHVDQSGGVKVVSSAGNHSVSLSVPNICTKNACGVILSPP